MPMPAHDDFQTATSSWWLRPLLYAGFASIGGLLGHVMRALDRKQRIKPVRAAIEGLGAGFAGLLMMMLCSALGLSEQWTGVIVGVTAWLGANATIRLLEAVIYKKLGIERSGAHVD